MTTPGQDQTPNMDENKKSIQDQDSNEPNINEPQDFLIGYNIGEDIDKDEHLNLIARLLR